MNDRLSDYERFLKPVHLAGKAVNLTIVKFTEEETHPSRGRAETSLVMWFREKPFGLILSPTNRRALMAACDTLSGWIGKPVTVKAVTVKVGSVDKTPIRIIDTSPRAPAPEPPADRAPEPDAPAEPEPPGDLDAVFGPNPRKADTPAPLLLPASESEFRNWQKLNEAPGELVRRALGCSDREWLKHNGSMSWSDVARQVLAYKEAHR